MPPALEVSIPMARTLSWSSVANMNSIPHTPLGQTMETPPNFLRLTRLNSESSVSIATTDDDEDIQSNNPRHAFADWPSEDDSLLLKVYEECLADPTLAPFAGSVPPSGILTLVAKGTLKRAKVNNAPFNHSISAIRKRLLLLCRRQEQPPPVDVDQEMENTFEFDTYFPTAGSVASHDGERGGGSLASPRGRKLFDTDQRDQRDQSTTTSSVLNSLASPYAHAPSGSAPSAPHHGTTTPVFRRVAAFEDFLFSSSSNTSSPLDGRGLSASANAQQPQSSHLLPHPQPQFHGLQSRSQQSPSAGSGFVSQRLDSNPEKTTATSSSINNWLLDTCNSPVAASAPAFGVALTTEGTEPSPTPPANINSNIDFPLTPLSPSVRRSQRRKPTRLDASQQSQYHTLDMPLASPFKEIPSKPLKDISFDVASTRSSPSFEPFPNYTAQRKRNSLNTKRGVK